MIRQFNKVGDIWWIKPATIWEKIWENVESYERIGKEQGGIGIRK